MGNQIPLFEIDWEIEDIQAAIDSIGRGSHWAKGPCVTEFESALEEYLDVDHAITVNSGTTALVAALQALGIQDGDEVIVPSFTFIATANAVKLVGAEPIFVDIEPETYGLAPEEVRASICEDTAAILPVHPYGTACQIAELKEIAREHDLYLIEDAAEVLGAKYRNDKLGTFGDVAALSFCQNKIVATGEGGAVVTGDDDLAEQIRLYRSHGRSSSEYFESAESGQYATVGTNIRMSDLTAAIGCSQLERIDSLIAGRRRAASQLTEGLEEVEGVQPHLPMDNASHVYQLYTIELDGSVDRSNVIETLAERDISSKIYWDPAIHLTSYYQETKADTPELPVTEGVSRRVISLPMHPNLSAHETARIIAAVAQAVE